MKQISVIISLVLCLSACSSKLAYNNISWLISWYIDDYIELTQPQEKHFDHYVTSLIQWHRQEELIKYKAHLIDIREDIDKARLNREIIFYHLDTARLHVERLRTRVSSNVALLAKELEQEQVIYLFAALEKDNKKQEKVISKEMEKGQEKFIEDKVDDIVDDLEDEMGKLTSQQKAIIAQFAPDYAPTGKHWLDYRRNIQHSARMLFILKEKNTHFSDDIQLLLNNPDSYRSAEYLALREKNRQVFLNLLVELAPTLTLKQKKKLVARINGLIDDIDDLMEA